MAFGCLLSIFVIGNTEENFCIRFMSHDEQKCGNIKEGNPEIRIRLDKFRLSVLFVKPAGEHSLHSRFIFIKITYRGMYSIVNFARILRMLF
jgi:hypothetical protein